MVSLFLLLGCSLSYIVDLFAGLHVLASASARTLLKLASSVRALLKPYGDTLSSPLLHAYDYCVISTQMSVWTYKYIRDFPQAMLDEKTKCSFFCETSTVTYVIYIIISMSTEITKKKNWQKSMATLLAIEINSTGGDIISRTGHVQIMFSLKG